MELNAWRLASAEDAVFCPTRWARRQIGANDTKTTAASIGTADTFIINAHLGKAACTGIDEIRQIPQSSLKNEGTIFQLVKPLL